MANDYIHTERRGRKPDPDWSEYHIESPTPMQLAISSGLKLEAGRRGLKPLDVSDMALVSIRNLRRFFTGEQVSWSATMRISRALNVKVSDILRQAGY